MIETWRCRLDAVPAPVYEHGRFSYRNYHPAIPVVLWERFSSPPSSAVAVVATHVAAEVAVVVVHDV